MPYDDQLHHKTNVLKQELFPLTFNLSPSIKSKEWGFRNKAKLTVTGPMEAPLLGLLGETDLDQGREILNCPVHHPGINKILPELKSFITTTKLIPYNIASRKGELKSLILYSNQEADQIYLRFVLRSKEALDRIKKNLKILQEKFPALQCISANIQPVAHAILEGKEEIILSDKGFINISRSDLKFKIGPQGFIQTNEEVAGKLYAQATEYVKKIRPRRFAELFCGQGGFSFAASPFIESGLGIDINPDAIIKAQEAAQENHLGHLKFFCADAKDVEKKLEEYSPDIVLVNPPRRGLGESVKWLINKSYPHLIYSSCSHESLSRDLKLLKAHYEIKHIQIFDMFPHTEHFETLVLLSAIKT